MIDKLLNSTMVNHSKIKKKKTPPCHAGRMMTKESIGH